MTLPIPFLPRGSEKQIMDTGKDTNPYVWKEMLDALQTFHSDWIEDCQLPRKKREVRDRDFRDTLISILARHGFLTRDALNDERNKSIKKLAADSKIDVSAVTPVALRCARDSLATAYDLLCLLTSARPRVKAIADQVNKALIKLSKLEEEEQQV